MTLRFLVDTNILSEPLRQRPRRAILRRLEEHAAAIAVPAPAWHELLFGCRRLPPSKRRDAIEDYLETAVRACFPILAYEESAAAWHAQERARLVAVGRTPPFVAGQIAAIAKIHGLTLVTGNTGDFRPFHIEVASW